MEAGEQALGTALPDELGDAELVATFRAGAELAFAELIRRHQIGVFRLLLGLLDSGDDAERACEQVFLEAARRIDELDEPARFYGWVLGLARMAAKKLEAARAKAPAPPRPRPKPRDPRGLVKQQVRDILGELSGDERLALILADLENDSYDAIATTLGTTALEAEAIVEQARTKFRAAVDQRDDGSDADAEQAKAIAPGTVIGGKYRVGECLGRGGMGAVYRAVDTETGATVALKVLLPESSEDAALQRRFAREAEAIRRVAHPHFVRYLGAGHVPGEPEFVVMELLNGQALSRVLIAEQRLAPSRALELVRQVLSGLAYAHGVGVVHRDVKPDNLMLVPENGRDEFVKILDLGIAKLVNPSDSGRTQLTQKGEVFGTPAYMAPEQVRGETVDGRADLYALAVMLFEMLAARPPFESKTSMGLLAMHLATPPPRLVDVAPAITSQASLQALLDRGLAKDPEERFASAEEFLEKVDSALAAGVDTDVKAGPPVRLGPPGAALDEASRREMAHAATMSAQVRARPSPPRAGVPWLRTWPSRVAAVVVAVALMALALWVAWGYVGR